MSTVPDRGGVSASVYEDELLGTESKNFGIVKTKASSVRRTTYSMSAKPTLSSGLLNSKYESGSNFALEDFFDVNVEMKVENITKMSSTGKYLARGADLNITGSKVVNQGSQEVHEKLEAVVGLENSNGIFIQNSTNVSAGESKTTMGVKAGVKTPVSKGAKKSWGFALRMFFLIN